MKKFILLILLLFTCITCNAIGEESGKSLFPHQVHLDESGCSDCHESGVGFKKPSFPEKDVCLECHDELPYQYKQPQKQTSENQPFIFSHTSHTKTDCQACHMIKADSLPNIPNQSHCSRCHSMTGIQPDCSSCHIKKFLPGSHDGLWKAAHTQFNNEKSMTKKHGQDCSACHMKPVCTSCHKTVSPKNHTGYFRTRGHGLKASIERKSCTTCHRESACIQCHKTTKPLNHRGQWQYIHGLAVPGGKTGSIGNCSVCHSPVWCANCHNR